MYQKVTEGEKKRNEERAQLQMEIAKYEKEAKMKKSFEEKMQEQWIEVRKLWTLCLPREAGSWFEQQGMWYDSETRAALKRAFGEEQEVKEAVLDCRGKIKRFHMLNPYVKLETNKGSVFHKLMEVRVLKNEALLHLFEKSKKNSEQLEQKLIGKIKETCAFFVALGYDMNEKDAAGRTILHKMAFMGEHLIMEYLIQASNQCAMEYEKEGKTKEAHLAKIKIEEQDDSGDTPLMDAGASGSLKTIEVLLAAGANPLSKNKHGQSMFEIAKMRGKKSVLDICRAFVEKATLDEVLAQPQEGPRPRVRL